MRLPNETADDRAFDYLLQQLYDAVRGYATAYAANVNPRGVLLAADLPTWEDLTDEDGAVLIDEFGCAVTHLIRGAGAVARRHQSTDNN